MKHAALIVATQLAIPICFAQDCNDLPVFHANGGVLGGAIRSGKQCLTVDLKQPRQFDIHAMRFLSLAGAPLLTIGCENSSTRQCGEGADIDLQNHRIEAEVDDMKGIQGGDSRNLRIHDGTVVVPGRGLHNIGIDLTNLQNPGSTYARQPCDKIGEACNSGEKLSAITKLVPYRETNNIVERVDVHAGAIGVRMVGIGNTIRNSVIEVDGRNGIGIFGPGPTIENNTIIMRGSGKATPDDGALTLWDGNDAVIRNNRFIFRNQFSKAPPAIRLIGSTNAHLEGNTFEGFDRTVEQTGQSSYREVK